MAAGRFPPSPLRHVRVLPRDGSISEQSAGAGRGKEGGGPGPGRRGAALRGAPGRHRGALPRAGGSAGKRKGWRAAVTWVLAQGQGG